MQKKGMLVAIVIALLAIAGVIYAVSQKSNDTTSTVSNNTTTPSNIANTSSPAATIAATITYSDSGFLPASVTIKSGGAVTFKNDSSGVIQVDSDPHPAHTDNPELNVGIIAPGQSKTVTLTAVGNWGYHNHLNSSNTGRITVQ